jgi:Chaperone of endosialidase
MRPTTINFKTASLFLAFILVSFFSQAQDIADAAIKKNISAINDPLQKLIQLSPKSFEYDHKNYKHLKLQAGTQYGFIAEDLQAIFPNLVKERSVSYMFGKNAYRQTTIKVIDEASLIPVLVAAIKEQQIAIENLKTEIQGLKKDQAMSN